MMRIKTLPTFTVIESLNDTHIVREQKENHDTIN